MEKNKKYKLKTTWRLPLWKGVSCPLILAKYFAATLRQACHGTSASWTYIHGTASISDWCNDDCCRTKAPPSPPLAIFMYFCQIIQTCKWEFPTSPEGNLATQVSERTSLSTWWHLVSRKLICHFSTWHIFRIAGQVFIPWGALTWARPTVLHLTASRNIRLHWKLSWQRSRWIVLKVCESCVSTEPNSKHRTHSPATK